MHVLGGVTLVSVALGRWMTTSHSRQERYMPKSPPLIAIVDDDGSMLRALSRLLTSAGYAAETYASAEEFLRAGLRPGVSCLVLDVQMPGITGLDLLVRLASSGVTLPVIIITAYADGQTCLQALQAGAAAFLYKPFEAPVFLDAIRRALGGDDRG
jgi:FixJ family two-component response regulator